MPEWLIEHGIGESRAVLVEGGEIVESLIEPDGTLPAGAVIAARLASVGTDGRNALACDESGREYLLPLTPPGATEGAGLNIEIMRPAIPGGESWKRPLGRVVELPAIAPLPLERRLDGRLLPFPPAIGDELAQAGWYDLIEEARSGRVAFPGGSLGIFLTPAMTLIDVDGHLPPAELAAAGAKAAAMAIRRHGIGGSIGIDLPTAPGKAPRQAAAEAIDQWLPQPFERTAVNGFGFVQIVRPRRRASLFEFAADRASFEARTLLRRAAIEGPGSRRIVAHPAIVTLLEGEPQWMEALARQIGGSVNLRTDPSLPISAAHVERS